MASSSPNVCLSPIGLNCKSRRCNRRGAQSSLGIKKECTLCKVERDGLAPGFAVVTVARRRRTRALSNDLLVAERLNRSRETEVQLIALEEAVEAMHVKAGETSDGATHSYRQRTDTTPPAKFQRIDPSLWNTRKGSLVLSHSPEDWL